VRIQKLVGGTILVWGETSWLTTGWFSKFGCSAKTLCHCLIFHIFSLACSFYKCTCNCFSLDIQESRLLTLLTAGKMDWPSTLLYTSTGNVI